MRQSPASATLARRQFVTGTLAGLPLLLHAPASAQQQTVAGAPDPVAQEILNEMIEAVNDMGRAPAESARRQARAFRMLAAFGQKEGLDKKLNDQIRTEIRKRGRNEIIFERPDLAAYARELRRLGVRADFSQLTETPLDFERKSKALDALLAGGVVAFTRRHAARLDALAPTLDAFKPARFQTKAEQLCAALYSDLYIFEVIRDFMCLGSAFWPWILPGCAVYVIAYFSFQTYIREYHQCT